MAASCSLASPVEAKSWRTDPTYVAWKANSSAAVKNAEAVEFFLKRQARACAADVFDDLLGLGFLRHGFLAYLRSMKAKMSQKPSVPQYA